MINRNKLTSPINKFTISVEIKNNRASGPDLLVLIYTSMWVIATFVTYTKQVFKINHNVREQNPQIIGESPTCTSTLIHVLMFIISNRQIYTSETWGTNKL